MGPAEKNHRYHLIFYIQGGNRNGSAAELSFKMESAKQWQKNVEEEFKRVDELLKLVAEELKTQPYEDDTIMMGLKKTGEALAEAFQTLSQNFMNAVAGLSDIMAEWSRTLTKILEAIAEAARKIGH